MMFALCSIEIEAMWGANCIMHDFQIVKHKVYLICRISFVVMLSSSCCQLLTLSLQVQ
jgi:hypothetical protein